MFVSLSAFLNPSSSVFFTFKCVVHGCVHRSLCVSQSVFLCIGYNFNVPSMVVFVSLSAFLNPFSSVFVTIKCVVHGCVHRSLCVSQSVFLCIGYNFNVPSMVVFVGLSAFLNPFSSVLVTILMCRPWLCSSVCLRVSIRVSLSWLQLTNDYPFARAIPAHKDPLANLVPPDLRWDEGKEDRGEPHFQGGVGFQFWLVKRVHARNIFFSHWYYAVGCPRGVFTSEKPHPSLFFVRISVSISR